MELNRLVGDSCSWYHRRIHLQIRIVERAAWRAQAQQPGQLCIRAHGNQVTTSIDPVAEQGHLRAAQRHLAKDHHIVAVEYGGRNLNDVSDGEGIQAFRTQNFGIVATEWIGRIGNNQDRPAWPFVGRRQWRANRGERPGSVGCKWVSGNVLDAIRAALDERAVGRRVRKGRRWIQRRSSRCRIVADRRRHQRVRSIAQLERVAAHRRFVHQLVEYNTDIRCQVDIAGVRGGRNGNYCWPCDVFANRGFEDHVDPVVTSAKAIGWEARSPFFEHTVQAVFTTGQRPQRCVVNGVGKVVITESVVVAGVIRRNIGGVRGHRNGLGQNNFLPAGGSFVHKCSFRELCAGAAPQVADMGSGVLAALVEAQPRDVTIARRTELHAQFIWLVVVGVRVLRCDSPFPDAARAGPWLNRYRHACVRRSEVATIISRAAPDCHRTKCIRSPGMAPGFATIRRVPGRPIVNRNLDAAHYTASGVARRATNCDCALNSCTARGRRDGCGGSSCISRGSRRDQIALQ